MQYLRNIIFLIIIFVFNAEYANAQVNRDEIRVGQDPKILQGERFSQFPKTNSSSLRLNRFQKTYNVHQIIFQS